MQSVVLYSCITSFTYEPIVSLFLTLPTVVPDSHTIVLQYELHQLIVDSETIGYFKTFKMTSYVDVHS